MFDSGIVLSKELQRYQKLEIEIETLTGFDLDELRRLFAAGYTLTCPNVDGLRLGMEILEKKKG